MQRALNFNPVRNSFKKMFCWYSLSCKKFARGSASASHDDEVIFPKQINDYQLEKVSNANYSRF